MSAERSNGDLPIMVRMLRVWSAARASYVNPMPHMVQALPLAQLTPELVPASASLFTLTEAVLGRPLLPECCCSTSLSQDERAILLVLHDARTTAAVCAARDVPNGLRKALRWAAFSVTRALADGGVQGMADGLNRSSAWPFKRVVHSYS